MVTGELEEVVLVGADDPLGLLLCVLLEVSPGETCSLAPVNERLAWYFVEGSSPGGG